ncbi:lysophospholipid acyltransferase family protein [Flavobacterium gilvum]|uniref:1-acyl-sn-glycerol-3-phosphate acyltransferase n=1 Tax=Flavobacterium gilvum TaxID=1492737 RepID=A0AAC9I1Q8_9FLAO|nr:lysophospholipid acyltransferase family protein [Flavobacterium gilvum]AOW08874.1 1-acyl-sn-glycerol-3-phosphate acyltransferase [Flavobacterium gilvum]
MQKLISYPLSLIVLILVLLTLVVFHPIQWICLHVFGYQAHKKSVDYLNFILLKIVLLLGTTFSCKNAESVPKGVPVIFVANHQSLYDIIAIIWFLRRYHPKFVSKKELGKGVPSVSFNLRHGGSVLIDRKDPKQAIPTIKKIADYIEKHKRSAVIFPEGTRSRNGIPKEFAQTGLKILCKNTPSAYVVPISINNSWKLLRYGTFPYGLGSHISLEIHDAFAVKDFEFNEIMQKTESSVKNGVKI